VCFVSDLSFNLSACVCARVQLKRILSIIALCLPREGKNTCVVPFVFVCVRALLSRSSRVEVVRSSFFDLVVLSSHMRDI